MSKKKKKIGKRERGFYGLFLSRYVIDDNSVHGVVEIDPVYLDFMSRNLSVVLSAKIHLDKIYAPDTRVFIMHTTENDPDIAHTLLSRLECTPHT